MIMTQALTVLWLFHMDQPDCSIKLKRSVYETKEVITPEESKQIEQQTRDQADSEEWTVE